MLVDSIKHFIEYAKAGVRNKIKNNFDTYVKPLKQVRETIDLFMIENEESINEIGSFLRLRDQGNITERTLEELLDLELKIDINRNYTINPIISKFDTVLGDFYFDDSKAASFISEYSNHYSAAYTPILEKVCYEWVGQLSSIFDEIDSHSWVHSEYLMDESLVDYRRKRLPSVKIEGLGECYSSVKLLMGKFVQIERAQLNVGNSLGNNPNSVKYMQAMLKSLPLTVNIGALNLGLDSNDIEESKFIDICRLL